MTKEESFHSLLYVPQEFKSFVIDRIGQTLTQQGFSKDDIRSRHEAILTECIELLNRFRFDLLEGDLLKFDAEIRQLRIDTDAKARGTDQFLGLRQMGWNSAEIEFVERSLQKNERVERCDAKNCHTNHGRDLNRLALREAFRPAYWTNMSTWNSQFPNL